MRRADVIAIALAVAAGVLGLSAGTGPLAGGVGAFIVAGIVARARSAHYITVWAVVPLLFWATYPDPSASIAAGALGACAIVGVFSAQERKSPASDPLVATRVTLAAAMVLTASALLSFDLLLR